MFIMNSSILGQRVRFIVFNEAYETACANGLTLSSWREFIKRGKKHVLENSGKVANSEVDSELNWNHY